jgi:hypothetical protein
MPSSHAHTFKGKEMVGFIHVYIYRYRYISHWSETWSIVSVDRARCFRFS